jgi:putative ABC transport system permease protein
VGSWQVIYSVMTTLLLALRMLRRDLRAGELSLLGIALALAVASLSSVAFLTERVGQGLKQQSHQLMGGDLLLTADHPWPQAQRDKATEFGIALAESITFPSMVSSANLEASAAQLADIKGVSANYPLRGALRVSVDGGKTDREIRSVPAKGTVWVDERLLSALDLKIGGTVDVGKLKFAVTEVLTVEPDKGFNVFNLAPRLLMNVDDLAATGLLQEGSRAQWRLQLAGAAPAIERYQQWAKTGLQRGEKVENLDNARPEVRVLLDRAQRFFSLAAMLAVVLAAVAITFIRVCHFWLVDNCTRLPCRICDPAGVGDEPVRIDWCKRCRSASAFMATLGAGLGRRLADHVWLGAAALAAPAPCTCNRRAAARVG